MNEKSDVICRTCLSEKANLKNIFNFAEILMKYFPIHIEEGDGLPSSICPECENKLNIVHDFWQLCCKSDEVLRTNSANKDVKSEEIYIKTDGFEDTSENNSDYKQDETFELEIDEDDDENLLDRRKKQVKQVKRMKRKTRHHKKQSNVDVNDVETDEEINNESDFELEGSEGSEKQMQCKYCDLKFRYKVRLKNHELKHLHGLKCHICNKDFSTLKQLTNHINIHSRKGAHLCQVCGKQFTLPENLVRHQRIHNGIRPYKCNLCNKSFTQSNELKSHIVTHTAEKNHLCSICGNKYSRSISLRVHIRRMHSIPANHRPYVCSVCERNFKDRRDLSQHMQIHTGERSHICKVCNKAFNRSSNLRVHERIHTGQKPHQCPVCHRAFIQKHVLITHMRTHPHNSQPDGGKLENEEIREEKFLGH